jgi:hypothetical protein
MMGRQETVTRTYGEIPPISRAVVLKSHEVKTGQRS